MNLEVEVTWPTFRTTAHSIMVHTQCSDEYIHLSLMNTTDKINLADEIWRELKMMLECSLPPVIFRKVFL